MSPATQQAPGAGLDEEVIPLPMVHALCGFNSQLKYRFSAKPPGSLSATNLGQAPSGRMYLSYNYTADHLISICFSC